MRRTRSVLGQLLVAIGTASVGASAAATTSSLPAFRDEADWQAYRAKVEAEISRVRASIAAVVSDAEPGEVVHITCPGTGRSFEAGSDRVPLLDYGPCTFEMKAGARKLEIPDTMWGVNDGSEVTIFSGGGSADRFPQRYVAASGIETGGLFKRVGDLFLFLRRGRLFSIRATGEELRLVSTVDLSGSKTGGGDWYEEMLIDDGTIVVLGYDSDRQAARIELFDLTADGRITHRDSYSRGVDFRSFTSAGNYASRLDGHTLVFHSSAWMDFSRADTSQLPALRRWDGKQYVDVHSLLPTDIYRTGRLENSATQQLHLMTRCRLDATPMSCRTTGVLAPHATFAHPGADAMYLWSRIDIDKEQFAVLRLPFDGSAPGSLFAQGMPDPNDHDAVLAKDGFLNAVVSADAETLQMWRSQSSRGGTAFFRTPISAFGDANAASHPTDYRALPRNENWHLYSNLYVGNWLLYSSSDPDRTMALRIDQARQPIRLPLSQVGMFAPAGDDAISFGYLEHEARIGSIELDQGARVVSHLDSPQGGTPDSRTKGSSYQHLPDGTSLFAQPLADFDVPTASVQFYRIEHSQLVYAGQLASSRKRRDDCKVSCEDFDWFGDARAIFAGERIYAWIGYELVEARFENGRISEKRRLDFTPVEPETKTPACYQGESYEGLTGPGTPVVMEDSFTGLRQEARADANGKFHFSKLPPGSYMLTIGSDLQSVESLELEYSGCDSEAGEDKAQ